jgi:hypothetical protein
MVAQQRGKEYKLMVESNLMDRLQISKEINHKKKGVFLRYPQQNALIAKKRGIASSLHFKVV